MRKSILLIAILLFSAIAFAQVPGNRRPEQAAGVRTLPPPLVSRTVSGVVKDSTDSTLPGAVVKLVSEHDTLTTSTNADGIFIFKTVKMASFTLTVSSIGYRMQVKKLLNNDTAPRLTLDPIILKPDSKVLNEVVINGTPSIVYKIDTIEYRASDYKVRPNATLDELLKKMEGFEVGTDGSVTHNGQAITTLKLNGKSYAGGDVASAIQSLPAEIIEKAQVVDDYGDQAARTGIKTGDPQKILNVTTKADRSVGNIATITGQGGNDDRYNASVYGQRLNANQQITLRANASNTVTGIGGGAPGTQRNFAPNLSYRDQYSKQVQVNSSFSMSNNDGQSTSGSYGTGTSTLGTNQFSRSGTSENKNRNKNGNFELEWTPDSLNFLQFSPSYSYGNSSNTNTNISDQINDYRDPKTGKSLFEHRLTEGVNKSSAPNTSYSGRIFFNHKFRKPRRDISLQVSYTHNENNSGGEQNNRIRNYANATRDTLIKDSIPHLINDRANITNGIRTSMTYSEPLGTYSQFEFNGQVNYNNHDTENTSDLIDSLGRLSRLNRATQIFNYATTETRLNFNYRFQGTRVNLSLGGTVAPYNLTGSKLNNTTGATVASSSTDFRILPIIRFSYAWSRTQRFNLNYTGTNTEPAFNEIQPFADSSDVNNIRIGNPNLKPSFRNSLDASYNNYFPNSRFNISINANASFLSNQSSTNNIQSSVVIIPGTPGVPAVPATPTTPAIPAIPATDPKTRIVNTITYVNLSGGRSYGGNYGVSKQLADRRYNLALNGGINYGYSLNMSNGELFHSTSWSFNERFNFRFTPVDNVEINPYLSTSYRRTFSTLKDLSSTSSTNSLGVDGRFYFLKTFRTNYSASKSFTTQNTSSSAVPIVTNRPFVVNAGIQKEFGAKRQFTVTFDVYDVLKQNNYVVQDVNPGGVTTTISNPNSRYFLLGFRLNLQKWSGRPQRGGRDMQRRGDGSFIYN